MSVLLIVVGAIIALLGLGSVGYGIPVKEFSFGNTLIIAGTTAAVGGLIILAIGALIGQLQRVAAILAAHEPLQAGHPAEHFEPPAAAHAMPPPPPIPFPERPKPPTVDIPPPPPAAHAQVDRPVAAAPMLRNPDAPVPLAEQFEVPEHDDVSLSPQRMPLPAALTEPEPPPSPPRPDKIFAPPPPPPPYEHRSAPPPAFADEPWNSPPPPPRVERPTQSSYFDTMWPADTNTPKRPLAEEPEPEAKPEPVPAPEPPGEPVAILKSGVVDGMAYTLYVDGSIEAELPHGTLRFASINELRDHLAKSA